MKTIEYSSICFNSENYKEKIFDAKKFVENNGFEFGVQIHNSIDQLLFNKLFKLKNDIKFSVHAPVLSKYFLNLASSDFELIKKTCDSNVKILKDLNTKIFFFHSLFMTDKPIVQDMQNYRKTMSASISNDFCLNESFIMNPKIFDSEIFNAFKDRFKINYQKIKALYPDFIISLENDFVGIGSGLQRPQEIFELVENLWFDLSHFWCSSLLHEFDYYETCDKIINEKNIVGVHLNHNLMTKSTPKEKLYDSHTHLYEKSAQDLKPIVKKLFSKNIDLFTLEIVDGDLKDIKVLIDWVNY